MCPTMRCMEDFKERLLSFIQAKGISIRKFEEICGLTNGTIGSIKAQGPTASIVSKISYAFPDLNLNWLFAGRGTMLINDCPSPAPTQNDIHHNQQVVIANWGDLREILADVIHAQPK